MSKLNIVVYPISDLTNTHQKEMYALYASYYQESNHGVFEQDLTNKTHVLLLTDSNKSIKGFSTVEIYQEYYQQQPINILYSGDTIIDQAYWGKHEFAATWLRFAGQIKAAQPHIPLYWLLIVKGHRTYRYLPLFSKNYYPCHQKQTPQAFKSLMDYLATKKFADHYSAKEGLIRFKNRTSFLRQDLAHIPSKDASRKEVQYFLQQNPGYAKGDELLCLCELTPENLTRFSKEWFLKGMKAH